MPATWLVLRVYQISQRKQAMAASGVLGEIKCEQKLKLLLHRKIGDFAYA